MELPVGQGKPQEHPRGTPDPTITRPLIGSTLRVPRASKHLLRGCEVQGQRLRKTLKAGDSSRGPGGAAEPGSGELSFLRRVPFPGSEPPRLGRGQGARSPGRGSGFRKGRPENGPGAAAGSPEVLALTDSVRRI